MIKSKIALFGGSFNPPGIHHRKVAIELSKQFDLVLVVPCGFRTDSKGKEYVAPKDRRRMMELTFLDLPKVQIDFSDIDSKEYTRTIDLDKKLREKYGAEPFHVIGTDLIHGGVEGKAEIQMSWFRGSEVWQNLRFVVLTRGQKKIDKNDLPPNSQVIEVDIPGSSTEIRGKVRRGEAIDSLVVPEVANYIIGHKLYLINV